MNILDFTLTFIKPDAFRYHEEIFALIQKKGFTLVEIGKKVILTKEQAEIFYAEHQEKLFFENLITFTCSGPIVAAIFSKKNAIDDFRKLIGATNPANADEGTIRKLYGNPELYAQGIPANAIHGSDSDQNVLREIAFFFSRAKLNTM